MTSLSQTSRTRLKRRLFNLHQSGGVVVRLHPGVSGGIYPSWNSFLCTDDCCSLNLVLKAASPPSLQLETLLVTPLWSVGGVNNYYFTCVLFSQQAAILTWNRLNTGVSNEITEVQRVCCSTRDYLLLHDNVAAEKISLLINWHGEDDGYNTGGR